MSPTDEWSPDQDLGTEVFEQGDEAQAEGERLDPDLLESVELDPSLDPTLLVDERELEEAGADFDDPERMVVPDGDIDDPDALGPPGDADDEDGWELDAPLAGDDEDEAEDEDGDEDGDNDDPEPEE
jgi:hypothetical protein